MSLEKKYMGYTFDTEEALSEAKKEAEAVAYLRNKTDFENAGQMLSLYNRMIDRKMVNTPIGLDFLKELREAVLKSQITTEDKLKPLPEIQKPKKKKAAPKEKKNDQEAVMKLKKQNAGLKVALFGALVIIIGMFVIVLTGKSSPLKSAYEEEILNRYSFWETELQRREQRIEEILYELEKQGITIEKESEPTNGTD